MRVQCRCSVRGRGREWGFRKGGRQAACNGSAALRRGQVPLHLHAVDVEKVVVVGRWQVGSGSVRFGGWREDGSGYCDSDVWWKVRAGGRGGVYAQGVGRVRVGTESLSCCV